MKITFTIFSTLEFIENSILKSTEALGTSKYIYVYVEKSKLISLYSILAPFSLPTFKGGVVEINYYILRKHFYFYPYLPYILRLHGAVRYETVLA